MRILCWHLSIWQCFVEAEAKNRARWLHLYAAFDLWILMEMYLKTLFVFWMNSKHFSSLFLLLIQLHSSLSITFTILLCLTPSFSQKLLKKCISTRSPCCLWFSLPLPLQLHQIQKSEMFPPRWVPTWEEEKPHKFFAHSLFIFNVFIREKSSMGKARCLGWRRSSSWPRYSALVSSVLTLEV